MPPCLMAETSYRNCRGAATITRITVRLQWSLQLPACGYWLLQNIWRQSKIQLSIIMLPFLVNNDEYIRMSIYCICVISTGKLGC